MNWLMSLLSALGVSSMDFSDFKDRSFEKLRCSPAIDHKADRGLFFNLPESIEWGASIPICGLLQGKDLERFSNLSFTVLVEPVEPEKRALYRLHEVQELGEKALPIDAESFLRLQTDGHLFFNIDGRHRFRPLPPGEFNFTLSYPKDLVSETKRLRVVPAGWRLELTNYLVDEICHRKLIEDLTPYLKRLKRLETVDLAPGAEQQSLDNLQALWLQGFSNRRKDLKQAWLQGLRETARTDWSLAEYLSATLAKKCPDSRTKGHMAEIINGLETYEAPLR